MRSYYKSRLASRNLISEFEFLTSSTLVQASKDHPTTGHEGPKRELYSSILSLTSALIGGGSSTRRPGRFTPGQEIRYKLHRCLGWCGQVRKISPPTGIRSLDRPARKSVYRVGHPVPHLCRSISTFTPRPVTEPR